MKSALLAAYFVMIIISTACSQSLHGIQKGYAFFKKSTTGNIQVDEKGNEAKQSIDTVRFIFIEWKGSQAPAIDTVLYKKEIFNASVLPVMKSQVEIGQEKNSGENIILKPATGNNLWRIVLTKTNKKNSLSLNDKIILKGRKNGQPFQWVIHKEVEIHAEITK